MATNTVIFDQVYSVLESVRSLLRHNYDVDTGETEQRLFFRCNEAGKAVRCDEDEWIANDKAFAYTVKWSHNNKDLRDIARDAMEALTGD